jgi:beta-glucosidase-like glycosyl hydrolase
MKENSLLNKRQRTITIKNKKYVELINYEGLSFTELDKIIKEIITSIEYSQENYIKLLEENKLLKKKIEEKNEEKNEEDNTNNLLLLKIENQRLKNENMKLMKKCIGLSDEASNEVKNEKVEVLQNYEKVKNIYLKNKITKNYDGTYTINGKNYKTLCGTREDVWNELSYKTSGGLKKSDLIININGKVVSKKKSIFESTNNKLGEINKERQKASIV